MADRIEFVVGDMFTTDLGEGYDVATAFQILHHFDEDVNVELLTRAREALRDGGTVAVLEQERPPTGERGSTIGALTGLLFYATSRARTYTATSSPLSSRRRASTASASGARSALPGPRPHHRARLRDV